MTAEFTVEKCKTKATYSAKLKKQQQLHLTKIAQRLEVILETPILLVIKEEGVEAVVHRYGEILFKNCSDVALMEKIARKVFELGLKREKTS
ncbi:hypothetical protein HYT55_01510 [Candidatus Woesearchaeota archaeon]|nr:hypothetical protein [Candidatus Woesearchaeota archaeon]